MTTIEQVRALVGNVFDDMPESEAIASFDYVQRAAGRPLQPSDAGDLRWSLENRRNRLSKKAAPKFAPEMYGTPRDFREADNAED